MVEWRSEAHDTKLPLVDLSEDGRDAKQKQEGGIPGS
jgi:hypothetical protein